MTGKGRPGWRPHRYVAARAHATIRTTPAVTLGIADRVWIVGDLPDAALATEPIDPVVIAPDRRRRFQVIEGGEDRTASVHYSETSSRERA